MNAMNQKTSYRTIAGLSQGIYKEKGSKFLGFAQGISSIGEAKEIVAGYKKKYHDARHHCFAYTIGLSDESQRSYDDGEPTHSAGAPILGQIKSFDLNNVLVVVVRYFGGTQLGLGNLTNAYKQAAWETLQQAMIASYSLYNEFLIEADHQHIQQFYRLVSMMNLRIIQQEFTEKARFTIALPQERTGELMDQINETPLYCSPVKHTSVRKTNS